jgi:hypothetical protein
MIDGTTPDNFIVNRGGYNCGHELIPVSEARVPKEVREKVRAAEIIDNKIVADKDLKGKLEEQAEFYKNMSNDGIVSAKNPTAPMKLNDEIVNMLEQNGYKINVSKKELISEYNSGAISGFNLLDFDNALDNLLQKYSINSTLKNKLIDIEKGIKPNQRIAYGIKTKNGDFIEIIRDFYMDNGVKTVDHTLFTMPSKFQGKGFSKNLFIELYKQYKNAGIEMIKVHANLNVGGYTWARYGFTAYKDYYSRIYRQFEYSNKSKVLSDEYFADFENWIKQYKGKDIPIYEISGKEYFKDIMIGSNWEGYLDFRNAAQKQYFENYIKE